MDSNVNTGVVEWGNGKWDRDEREGIRIRCIAARVSPSLAAGQIQNDGLRGNPRRPPHLVGPFCKTVVRRKHARP